MDTFLKAVAQDLAGKFQNQLQHITLVFPNKRASLFMNEFLAQASDRPLWAPTYTSISDLFRQFSPITVPDKIQLICELYPIYRNLRHLTEQDLPLDRFYAWGELLLADFDDVDKNLVPAEKLFQNLQELKAMDTSNFLSEEQKEALEQFFESFQFRNTEIQQEFIHVWKILYPLYTEYKKQLLRQKHLYEGALFRQVVEHFDSSQLTAEKYVFVGFNVLDKAEETLFRKIQEAGKALFYWDYDPYYLNQKDGNMEAGTFLRRNMLEFGNELPESCFQAMKQPKDVEIISAATENAQVCHIAPWLRKNLTEKESETAVILCNESLLEPVLHTLPHNVKNLNITMGFPFSSTPVFSFIKALCELQIAGYSPEKGCYRFGEVHNVLLHPYTQLLSAQALPLLTELTSRSRFFPQPLELQKDEALTPLFPAFPLCDDTLGFLKYLQQQVKSLAHVLRLQEDTLSTTFAPLYREALYTAYTLLNRLVMLVEQKILTVTTHTLIRFIDQLMGGASIPFHGEPVIGLQVMGVLETRCLDFRHLMILSLNEGLLPKNGNNASFIPYNLRKAFQMTLTEQKTAVYAYYFYRLIQRAEKVTFVYNDNTEGLQKGEMSRFLLQYLLEHPDSHAVRMQMLSMQQKPLGREEILISKTPEMMQHLLEHYQKEKIKDGKPEKVFLSPSALNTYIDCPLKFYFKYVAHLKAPEVVTDEIDSALFGTIFHRCSEKIYLRLTHGTGQGDIHESQLSALRKDEFYLHQLVSETLKEELFQIKADAEMPTLNGTQLIIRQVLILYLKNLLDRDLQLVPFTIRGLEKSIREKFTFTCNGTPAWIYVGGEIDRMDEYTDKESGARKIRIIDYKTSKTPQDTGTLEDLFENSKDRRQYHALQAFFYAMQVNGNDLNPLHEPIAPSLFYIQKAAGQDYLPKVDLKAKPEPGKKSSPSYTIDDFEAQIGTDYRRLLREKMEELFSLEIPFTPCTGTSFCQHCDFRNLCRR